MKNEKAALWKEIKSRAVKVTTASPWDSAVLAREIAEKMTMLKDLTEENRREVTSRARTSAGEAVATR